MKKKLTDAQVREIRRLKKKGWTIKELAYKYGVAAPTVSRILDRKRRV